MEAPTFDSKFQDKLTGEGKLLRYPARTYESATVLTINFDHLAVRLKDRLRIILPTSYAVVSQMPSLTYAMAETEIGHCIDHMVDLALLLAYNRLRYVAKRYSPATRTARMNHRAPYGSDHEFPTFIASLLSSLGPLRITDGLEDTLVIYSTEAANANHYGRAATPVINIWRTDMFTEVMARAGMEMSKIDIRSTLQGSFCTTIIPDLNHNLWTFSSTQHPSHYEDLDLLRAWFILHDDINFRCVAYCGLVIEKNTTAAITTAVTAACPANIAAGYDAATAAADPIGLNFPCNHFGILPAVPAPDQVAAVPAAVYILGRGTTVYSSTILGSRLSEDDMIQWAQAVMF